MTTPPPPNPFTPALVEVLVSNQIERDSIRDSIRGLETDRLRSEADSLRRRLASTPVPSSSSNFPIEVEVEMKRERERHAAEVASLMAFNVSMEHQEKAMRRLLGQYRRALGKTLDEANAQYSQLILDIAEEDPRFADTECLRAARKRLAEDQG